LLILLTLLPLVACRPSPEAVKLLAVPEVNLAGSEPEVREQLGSHRRTLEELLPQVHRRPVETAEAFGQLGLLYLTYEIPEPAVVCFENASRLAGDDYRWPYLKAYLDKQQGRLAAAETGFRRALELEPDFLPALLRLAQTHLELGELPAAQAGFEQSLELEPKAAVAYDGLGKVAMARGDGAAAVRAFEEALALEPRANALHYSLAQAYRDLGDEGQAAAHLAQRGDVTPRLPDPLLNPLASIAAGAQFYLVQGAEAMENGDLASAEASYRLAVEREPGNLTALRGLAFSLEGQGDQAGAVAALEAGLGILEHQDPADLAAEAEVLGLLGEALGRAGRNVEAANRFGQSLALDADQPLVRLQLADALGRAGRLEQALEIYQQLLSQEGVADRSSLHVKRATAWINLGQQERALEDFRRAADAAPEDPRPRWRWADALEFLGDAGGAAEQRKIAGRLLPPGAAGAALLAEEAGRQARRGALDGAAASYRRALELDAASVPARIGLGQVLLAQGQVAAAEALFREALGKEPRSAPAHHGLIRSLVLAGRFGEARLALQEALRLFPRDSVLALTQVRLLASCPDPAVRDGGLALEIGLRVHQAAASPAAAAALALAQAESGNLAEAQALQARLLENLPQSISATARSLLEARQKAFQAGRSWTAGSGEEILGLLDP
jgi:tetratricopeptide (TPR) repeat protein